MHWSLEAQHHLSHAKVRFKDHVFYSRLLKLVLLITVSVSIGRNRQVDVQ
jgi:hypothetical protein